jgi:hypothetical protein
MKPLAQFFHREGKGVASWLCISQTLVYVIIHLLKFTDTNWIFLLQYLDENKQLILAILENQNLGKLAECAQ